MFFLCLVIWHVLRIRAQAISKQPDNLKKTITSHESYYATYILQKQPLTHWCLVMHICVGKLTIIGSDHGLAQSRRQASIWTNAEILLTDPLGTNLSEISIEIHTFSIKKMRLKVSSAKWRLFCLGLNVLNKHCSRKFGRSSIHWFLW